jgi:hypothetical protein
MIENNGLIPNHQFSFRQRNSTIEQTHWIIRINEALENKQYRSAAFLDISQAFNKVWHTGLLYKLRLSLPLNYFLVLKFYLYSRHFLVKAETEYAELSPVNAGTLYQPHQNTTQQPLLQLTIQCLPQCTPKWPISELHGATRQQVIAKTPPKCLEPITYRGVLLSTLLHATVYV